MIGQVSAAIGSCNNIEDVVDVDVEDNVQDNGTTTVEEETDVGGSFDTED